MSLLLVVTGASEGLGAALSGLAVAAGHRVVAIARSPCPYGDWLQLDLAQPGQIEQTLPGRLAASLEETTGGVVLVNNAATIDPIGTGFSAAEAGAHVAVNLIAPMVLSQVFLRSLADNALPKRVVNLSSGASERAFEGWSLYCASKAGLDHFGRCLALEQQRVTHPADVVAVSPGVIDTAMQARIRASDPTQFPDRSRFVELESEGKLSSPQDVAAKLLRGIESPRRFAGERLPIDEFAGWQAG